jgi:sulfate adenylyltransferase large subunit
MSARPDPNDFAFDHFLRHQHDRNLLRFVACGSVDHGKSTLIGRLLYETKQIFEDQLDRLAADSHRSGTQGGALDFSLLLDGLAAEREQKITIDVAYRFFTTDRRKFIVIDAPGHEQYTPNMATGASNADVALILVNAASGLTAQTRRHTLIVAMLGVRHVVLAVNKMDLVGWSEKLFRSLEVEFYAFARAVGVNDAVCIPLAALSGDNVVTRSRNMDWYRGPTLLDYLEDVDASSRRESHPFRMPIQLVNRPDPDFRGYSGRITSGEADVGMAVRILPSGSTTRIARIVTYDGDLDRATAGDSVTLTFTEEIDASRGELIAAAEEAPAITGHFSARIFWMDSTALAPGRNYWLKLAATTVAAKIEADVSVIDVDNQRVSPGRAIAQNEIGRCVLALDRKIAVDRFDDAKETGSFILIDPESYDTVGMGCIDEVHRDEVSQTSGSALRVQDQIPLRAAPAGRTFARWRETHARSLAKALSWRATGSLDTFLVAFVITGSPKIAGSVAVTEILTKILIYYFHERLWALVPWGKR